MNNLPYLTKQDIFELDPNRPYEIDPAKIFTTRLAKQILVEIPPKVAKMLDIPLSYQERTGVNVTSGGLSGSLENRGIIADKSLEWDPSKMGYDPQKIIAQLQSAELVNDWEDPVKQRKVYNSRIEIAVTTAGKNLLRDFTAGLEKLRGNGGIEQLVEQIEQVYGYKEGVLALTPYYGGDNKTEGGKAGIQKYIGRAEEIWNETTNAALTYLAKRLQSTATEGFDPRQTPERVEKQVKQLSGVLKRYNIASPEMESFKDEIIKNTYKSAYEKLLPEVIMAIRQPQAVVMLDEIAAKPFTPSEDGSKGLDGYIPVKIEGGEGILYVPKGMDLTRPSRLVPTVPGKDHENLAGRYAVKAELIAAGDGKKILYTATKVEPGKEPDDNLKTVLDDIDKVFEYGYSGGVDIKELAKAKQSMLEANDHRKLILTDLVEMLQSDAYDSTIKNKLLNAPAMIGKSIEDAWKICGDELNAPVGPQQETAPPQIKKRRWYDPRGWVGR